LCFVGQVYANLDALDDFHRMLYIFACVSDKCIGTQCVKVYRGLVQDKNSMVQFISDSDYNSIVNKTDEDLATTKWSKFLEDVEEYDADDNPEDESKEQS
jgi:hypothetical protein